MDFRGSGLGERQKGRQSIARRSCDQCRVRKIGCDRLSPCSNCVSARVDCTHSAVASHPTTPKQRVLISTQYQQKIDDIASGIDSIKLLLQGTNLPPYTTQSEASSIKIPRQDDTVKPLVEHGPISAPEGSIQWDHSHYITEFVQAVVDDEALRDATPEANEVVASLRSLLQTLNDPNNEQTLSVPEGKVAQHQTDSSMPPLDAVVAVLRWAKVHESNTMIALISRILPVERFAEICRTVYFAIDDYSAVDFLLANGYLTYIFFEHFSVSGRQDYREYGVLCRSNLQAALSRLPLLLAPSMEAIAALTLGALYAIENSKTTMAWTLISSASNLCQRLGYHRPRNTADHNQSLRAAQGRLFWTIHRLDRGLSLRLGRPSNIRDSEVALPIDPNEPRSTKVARIQGMVYDQLYSPVGLSRSDGERGLMATIIAGELRELISHAHIDVSNASERSSAGDTDPLRFIYMHCELVCQSSLLTFILRAVPDTRGSLRGVSDECVAAARHVFDLHHRCMVAVRGRQGDSFMLMKYINWAILHTPFLPFSIIFSRAVQLYDVADLVLLERFATSLEPETASAEVIGHPSRLYVLLCQAARLYIDSSTPSISQGSASAHDFELQPEPCGNESLDDNFSQIYALSDWYYDNQQIMSLLDENTMF